MSKMVLGNSFSTFKRTDLIPHSLPCPEINPKGSKSLSQGLYFDNICGKDIENILNIGMHKRICRSTGQNLRIKNENT